mmetsp:Transcript_12432/g.27554  ORF Transcript_12432/g.27554 Transcript_12432/m.27554 type:complete len:130 (-) Transcript_12432:109-498(-)
MTASAADRLDSASAVHCILLIRFRLCRLGTATSPGFLDATDRFNPPPKHAAREPATHSTLDAQDRLAEAPGSLASLDLHHDVVELIEQSWSESRQAQQNRVRPLWSLPLPEAPVMRQAAARIAQQRHHH